MESETPDFSSAEAFRAAAELVDDSAEFDMICRLLNGKNEKLTQERVLDEALISGMDWKAIDRLKQGFEKVGFPQEDEPMEVDFLSPREIKEMLQEGSDGHAIFNNEFALFAYAPGRKLEDFEPQTIIDMSVQLNPVRQRLRSLAPGLVRALEEYAVDRTGMSKFYKGLAEDRLSSQSYVTLFAIADQLLQRLVRPGDEQYKSACAREWSGGYHSDKMFVAPVYDTLSLTSENIVTNARRYLYT
jgi:hypothetical protein